MKKLIALTLGLVMLSSNVYGQITTNYITEDVTTTAANYSISGSSDPNYPLYINGEEITNRTESGYFSYYISLALGKNEVLIDNTTDSKTISISRKEATSGSGSATEDVFNERDVVGRVSRNHPTVRSRADEADDDLIGPYVKDTLVHITGENSEYYRTANGAYLYTDSVNITDEVYGDNAVKDINASGSAVEIKMDRATEYKCELTSDGLILTLYDTVASGESVNIADGVFADITTESESPAVYNIKFKEKNSIIGYMCYFNDDTLRIEFNERTKLSGKSLDGVKIVLDAGHGGWDAGTAGLGEAHEKDITLSIVNYLNDYLTARGATTVYTRTDDSYVALTTRTAKIISEAPDLSVSIHCNSMGVTSDFNKYSGTLNLYTYDTPTQFVEKLTELISGSTYRKQNLALTRTSVCPAVLIETGFICNPVEYEYLSKPENQKIFAEKVGSALEQYFYGLENTTVVEGSTITTAVTETTTETTTASSSSSGGGSSRRRTTTTTEATTESTTAVLTEAATEATTSSAETKAVLSDISGHWAEEYIISAFNKGIVKGYVNGEFKPNGTVTRAEFLQTLYNILGNDESKDTDFADINGNEWYYDCVKWGVANGLINGYEDNTFRANKEISREEAAVILARCVNLTDTSNSNGKFTDEASISSWAKSAVDKIAGAEIIKGDNNGRFNPKNSLTRAETAVLADRISK